MTTRRTPSLLRATALALCSLGLVPTHALAQVNIESLRSDEVPEGISGALTGNLVVKTGNTDFVELSANARLNWVRGPAATLLIADGGLGFLRGNRFASGGLLHLRHTRWLNDRVAGEAFGQMNYDRPQLLDFRSLAGAGVRLHVAGSERGALGLGSSIMLEEERLDLPASAVHPERTTTWRNSTFVTLRLAAGDNLVVSSTAYLQPALSDLVDDLRIIENLSVVASLTDRLALNVTFDLRYDSGPPDDIAALDTHLKTGLTFRY